MDKILLALAEMKADLNQWLFTTKPAADDAALQTAQAALATAQASLATAKADLASRDQTIADLQVKLGQLQAADSAKADEIAGLKVKLDTETRRTTETLAAQGVDPKLIPAAPAPNSTKPGAGLTGLDRAVAVHAAQTAKK